MKQPLVKNSAISMDPVSSWLLHSLLTLFPKFHPNYITILQLVLAIVFCLRVKTNATAMIVISLLGAWCDRTDGQAARKYGLESDLGKYLDQMIDKLANYLRLFWIWWMLQLPLYLDIKILDGRSLLGLWIFAGAILFDLPNAVKRTRLWWSGGSQGEATSAKIGQAKTWLQNYGVSLLTIAYAGNRVITHSDRVAFCFALAFAFAITCAIFPGQKKLKDPRWWGYLGANLTLLTMLVFEETRHLSQMAGEIILYLSVIFAGLSRLAQFRRARPS